MKYINHPSASVHRSVSESAIRLFGRYGAQLDGSNLDKIIATINTWADALPSDSVNDAAKRCVKRLSLMNVFATEPKFLRNAGKYCPIALLPYCPI